MTKSVLPMATINGDTQSYLIFFFLSIIISRFLLRNFFKIPSKIPYLHLPPSPPALPFIGHLHLLRLSVWKSLRNLSTNKYGSLLYLRLGSRPVLVVSSPAHVAEIYKTNDIAFSAKPYSPFEDMILFGNTGFIVAPYGDYWKFMKKLCMTELLGSRQIERSRGVRCEEITSFLKNLLKKSERQECVDMIEELSKLMNNAICRMVMSNRCSGEDDEAQRVRKLVIESFDLTVKAAIATMVGPLKRLVSWWNREKLEGVLREFDNLFEKIMKEHEEVRVKRSDNGDEKEDRDLMDILLNIYYDKNTECKISRNQIKAFILDLFIAGTDTSANTMQWVMAELINNPHIFKKLRHEIDSIVGSNTRVQESDISNLHYLQAVVKESMRLHPAAPAIPRECREDCQVSGFDIPKGTAVIINAYSIMRDPNLWDNPEDFIPERFLNEQNNLSEAKIQNFNFLPFGGGRRTCPGSNMALSIIHLTIATLVQCFDWKIVGDKVKVNMESKPGFALGMLHPLMCIPVVRFDPFVALD
ncbi:cytochrome P450 705A22-like [Mercurialis annua]|uniref:cytochrome P450 705A22-like n=1 Tax=Mercurialis annua TaxID=3986 RepID=UPI0024AF7867|nr:cytochrome P450 705A22-like [Mercurialis annua]